MKISVIGAGYVGLTTGTCLAEIGHTVRCADNDEAKLGLLQSGRMPFFELYLAELVRKNCERGRLRFDTTESAVVDSEAIFICVGTGHRLKRQLELYAGSNVRYDIVSNPEFLREGSAIEGFFHPDRIVIGGGTGGGSGPAQGNLSTSPGANVSVYETAEDAEAVLIATERQEFRGIDWYRLRAVVGRALIVDGRNAMDAKEITRHGFHYVSVGRAAVPAESGLDDFEPPIEELSLDSVSRRL